jgi:predicted ATP-binding protein involved in virulence
MELMRFSRLSLLSNKERRGLQIDLSAPATVLVAGNGFGKSVGCFVRCVRQG